jgi:tRNA U34 5-carboxymethylaminomethyl modifying GTPase MnmE/TrmE
MNLERQLSAIKARGRIEGTIHNIRQMQRSLEAVPLWLPTAGLKGQTDEVLGIIQKLSERLEHKLVVTIIGPCGSGKSTLLNALAGVDDLSPTGVERPTTRGLIVFGQEREDAKQFMQHLGQETVSLRTSPAAANLENLLIIDTPDTDSVYQKEHIPVIEKAIGLSDVLLCVFDGENPKRKDHADFMAPFIGLFNGDSLLVCVNKCDRQSEEELLNRIMPEFSAYLQGAWSKPVAHVLLISARSCLKDPQWDPKAPPRHDLNQFDELKRLIFETFNRSGYSVDRRLENAATLEEFILSGIRSESAREKENLTKALAMMQTAEQQALAKALSALKGEDAAQQMLGINVRMYQKLAQRWLGPVGWMVALWARILIFGTGFAALFRFGNPIRQVWGMLSSLRHYKESNAAVADTRKGERVDTALREYRADLYRQWPDIAEILIRSRFDPAVRRIESFFPDWRDLGSEMASIWGEALEKELERASAGLSRLPVQLLFNLPAVAVLGYAGWLTADNFFTGEVLSSDFFLHAVMTAMIIILLSFFLLQGLVRLAAGRRRIHRRAFMALQERMGDYRTLSATDLGRQVDGVLSLNGLGKGNQNR